MKPQPCGFNKLFYSQLDLDRIVSVNSVPLLETVRTGFWNMVFTTKVIKKANPLLPAVLIDNARRILSPAQIRRLGKIPLQVDYLMANIYLAKCVVQVDGRLIALQVVSEEVYNKSGPNAFALWKNLGWQAKVDIYIDPKTFTQSKSKEENIRRAKQLEAFLKLVPDGLSSLQFDWPLLTEEELQKLELEGA